MATTLKKCMMEKMEMGKSELMARKECGAMMKGGKMPSKGMHKMPGGMMMKDSEMKQMMQSRRTAAMMKKQKGY